MRNILLCAALGVCPIIASAQTCSGLVGWWSFEGDAADRSGHGNHGTVFGDPAFVPGTSGQALLLDGIDDFVEVADSPTLNPVGAISISAWWWSTAFSGSGSDPIVDKGASCHCWPYYQYQLGVSGSLYNYPSSFSFIVAANGAPGGAGTDLRFYSVGRWYHIVGVYDGAEARMYVDGRLVSNHPVSGPIASYGRPVRFGRFNNLPQYFLPGAIDEVRIYDRALSADEAALLHDSPAGDPVVRPVQVTTCPGGQATFSVVHLAAPDATYAWSRDGVPISGADAPTLTVTGGPASVGAYTCLVTSSCGSAESSAGVLAVCGSDFNCDGFVDFFDYDDYVNCFETGACPPDRTADFNGDGFADFFDYDDFVTVFEAGC